MPFQSFRLARNVILLALPALLLGACGSVTQQHDLTTAFKPFRVDVVQGNFVSREMAAQLKPGMTQAQVRDILGTPLLDDLFHADRWDYVFSLRRGYRAPLVRRFSVFFDKDGKLLRTQGDPLPSENEFVAQIESMHANGAKRRVVTSAQLQAEIAAADKKIAATPSASAPSGPLTIVAPASEIERLQSLTSPDGTP